MLGGVYGIPKRRGGFVLLETVARKRRDVEAKRGGKLRGADPATKQALHERILSGGEDIEGISAPGTFSHLPSPSSSPARASEKTSQERDE